MQILSAAEDKIQHAKSIIFENLKDSMLLQYTKYNGNWNGEKIRNEIEDLLTEDNIQMDTDI